MERENLHILDKEMAENISDMLNSRDENTIRLALVIINNVDLRDKESGSWLSVIMQACTGLHFAFFKDQISNNITIKYHFEGDGIFVDDETTTMSMYSGYVGNV